MSFKFNLILQGLLAIAPSIDKHGAMIALLIDARAPGKASTGVNHVSHSPNLRVNVADLDEKYFQPAMDIVYDRAENAYQGVRYFNGNDLQVRYPGQSVCQGRLKVDRTPGNRDFSLIPHAKHVYPETGGLKIDPACLFSKDLLGSKVVGRIKLEDGTISAYAGKNGELISSEEYAFTGMPGQYRQRMASGMLFQREINADFVELHSPQNQESIFLRPSNGKSVDIVIENIPTKGVDAAKPQGDADIDYELVYLVSNPMPQQLRVPIRVACGPEFPSPLFCGAMIYNDLFNK